MTIPVTSTMRTAGNRTDTAFSIIHASIIQPIRHEGTDADIDTAGDQ